MPGLWLCKGRYIAHLRSQYMLPMHIHSLGIFILPWLGSRCSQFASALYKKGKASFPFLFYLGEPAGSPTRSEHPLRQLLYSKMGSTYSPTEGKSLPSVRLTPWSIFSFRTCRKLHFLRSKVAHIRSQNLIYLGILFSGIEPLKKDKGLRPFW